MHIHIVSQLCYIVNIEAVNYYASVSISACISLTRLFRSSLARIFIDCVGNFITVLYIFLEWSLRVFIFAFFLTSKKPLSAILRKERLTLSSSRPSTSLMIVFTMSPNLIPCCTCFNFRTSLKAASAIVVSLLVQALIVSFSSSAYSCS